MTNNKRIWMGLALGVIVSSSGCDDTPIDETPYCRGIEGGFCEPAGFPLVTGAFTRSDACPVPGLCPAPLSKTTAVLTQPEAGKLCMKGTVVGRDGWSEVILSVSRSNKAGTHITDVLDAKSMGIAQLKFTIEQPPLTGVTVLGTAVRKRDCLTHPECLDGSWLRTGPRSATIKVLDHSETVMAPFTDFVPDDPNLAYDTSQLGDFLFILGAGDYDFCLSNLSFLSASGVPIAPPGDVDAGVTSDATEGS